MIWPFKKKVRPYFGPADLFPTPYGFVPIVMVAPNIYKAYHPRANHAFVSNAASLHDFRVKVMRHLRDMSSFGGNFAKLNAYEWTEML